MNTPLDINRSPSVFVYTMGKVASTSLSAALRAADLTCVDIHFLDRKRILQQIKRSLDLGNPQRHIYESLVANAAVHRARQQGRVIKVISSLRPPVQRNLSAAFHGLSRTLEGDASGIRDAVNRYRATTPDIWFAEDLLPATGIDAYALDVDTAQDHFRTANENFDVLFLKTSMSDARKSDVISAFVGRPVSVGRENVGERKWYADVYRQFTSEPGYLKPEWVAACLKQRYFKTFYSAEEQRAEASRFWSSVPE